MTCQITVDMGRVLFNSGNALGDSRSLTPSSVAPFIAIGSQPERPSIAYFQEPLSTSPAIVGGDVGFADGPQPTTYQELR
jgi:hypothetical protein